MDITFSQADRAFREEVRAFIRENLPRDVRERARRAWLYLPKEDHLRWQKILYERGWIAPHWPAEHGGPGWTPIQRYIFEEECAAADCPRVIPFGVMMVGPVIYTFGSEEQKRRYLPRILSSEDWWCQGYSEPGAGSDLASLKTRAVREGDHYVVNGQKTWTSGAHKANRMFCLARTGGGGKPQEGITFLLVDMHRPGITVKPIVTMDEQHYLNDVFLDGVRVPVADRIGEEGKGWTYAKFLLGHERTGIAGVGRSKQRLERLKEMARQEVHDGGTLLADPDFSREVAELEADLTALEITNLRSMASEAGGDEPDPVASILKIKGTEIEQRINELMVETLGYHALPLEPPLPGPDRNEPPLGPEYAAGVTAEHLLRRASSIYGGTNEIQKNIIAKMVLGF